GFVSLCVQPSGYFRVDEEGEWIDSVIYSEKVKRNDPVIKLPESKKSRKLKRRLGGIKEEVKVEEEEVAGYYVESGGRVCYNEKEDFGLEDWGIKIEKKKEEGCEKRMRNGKRRRRSREREMIREGLRRE
ncbi:hypothetical protein CWI39_3778p0010, partial [Hamiltosporidium magnivora]